MNDLLTFLLLAVGEAAGDATFFFKGARRGNKTENNLEEKRKQSSVCKYSLFLVIHTMIECVVWKGFIFLVPAIFPALSPFAAGIRKCVDYL